MVKAAVFFATGFEEIEAIGIVDTLRRGGLETDMISVSGNTDVEGGHGITVRCDLNFYSVDYSFYDLLVLPGGMPGTLNLGKHEDLGELLKSFAAEGKKLAAICAAPSVLGELGLLKGVKATCYPGYEEKLEGAVVTDTDVVKDGNFTTGRGPGVVMNFALEILKWYNPESKVEEQRNGMIVS